MKVVERTRASKGLEVEQLSWGAVLTWSQCEAQDNEAEGGQGHLPSLDSKSVSEQGASLPDGSQAVSHRIKWNMECFL